MLCCIKAFTALDMVWITAKSPILGLLLLLSVFPLLSDFSEPDENFIKIKFFNLFSNFDKTSQKIKKAILYGNINYNNIKHHSINMISKLKAPIWCSKNPVIYNQNGFQLSKK